MAHLISEDIFGNIGFENKPVVTEKLTEIYDFTREDVGFILHLLAYNNTRYEKTAAQLEADYGLKVHPNTLRNWVSSLFVQEYVKVQHELEQQLSDKLSAQTVDIAAKAIEATDKVLDQGIEKIGDLKPHEISAAAKNYADVAQKNVQVSQLMKDQPTSIIKHQTPDDALQVLKELGLLRENESPVEELPEGVDVDIVTD